MRAFALLATGHGIREEGPTGGEIMVCPVLGVVCVDKRRGLGLTLTFRVLPLDSPSARPHIPRLEADKTLPTLNYTPPKQLP